MVSSTPQPHFTPRKALVPILQEAGWAPGPVWTGGKSRPHRDSIPDRPARSQSLYRLSYPAHLVTGCISLLEDIWLFCSSYFSIFLCLSCVILCMVVCFVCFCLILKIMYSYCYVCSILCILFHCVVLCTVYV